MGLKPQTHARSGAHHPTHSASATIRLRAAMRCVNWLLMTAAVAIAAPVEAASLSAEGRWPLGRADPQGEQGTGQTAAAQTGTGQAGVVSVKLDSELQTSLLQQPDAAAVTAAAGAVPGDHGTAVDVELSSQRHAEERGSPLRRSPRALRRFVASSTNSRL
mmetsp:Transcript_5280/g.10516  ORF Transcript_5280/g.10516 Transcript_5280/m.10516 type:complete len:161 (+) Transcript_5280:1-483(+)